MLALPSRRGEAEAQGRACTCYTHIAPQWQAEVKASIPESVPQAATAFLATRYEN